MQKTKVLNLCLNGIGGTKHDMPAKAAGKCVDGFQPEEKFLCFQHLFVVDGGTLQK